MENPQDTSTECELYVSKFSEVGENKQLLMVIVIVSFYSVIFLKINFLLIPCLFSITAKLFLINSKYIDIM